MSSQAVPGKPEAGPKCERPGRTAGHLSPVHVRALLCLHMFRISRRDFTRLLPNSCIAADVAHAAAAAGSEAAESSSSPVSAGFKGVPLL